MADPLKTTFEVLSNSRNESAVPVLISALDSSDGRVYESAISTLVARRSKVGHLAVLGRWHVLTPEQRELVLEGRGRMSGAMRDAVLSDDDQLFNNACELVEQFTEFDLVPTLVTLAENKKSEHAQAATDLVVRLVNRLSEMLHGKKDKNDRRDPDSIRRYVLESLERSIERYMRHERLELIEAFVILAGPSCGLLRKILDSPTHPCYNTVINTLANSQSTGVHQLLINFLRYSNTSLNVLNVISRREDEPFIDQLLQCASSKNLPKFSKNLGRIRSFGWIPTDGVSVDRFAEEDQERAIRLVTNSGMSQEDQLAIIERVIKYGEPAGRCAACEALASIPGDRPSQLVLRGIRDTHPTVQAAATRQLRDRHLPGTMAMLLKLIDSPHEIVQEASRQALSEFSFENFLTRFDTLSDDARRSTASVVRKVDVETIPSLQKEMENKSRRARLRAVEMAEVMQLVDQLSEAFIALLEDEDHLVRAASADALQLCQTEEVREALLHATKDKSSAVQNAAKSSLATFVNLPASPTSEVLGATEGQL